MTQTDNRVIDTHHKLTPDELEEVENMEIPDDTDDPKNPKDPDDPENPKNQEQDDLLDNEPNLPDEEEVILADDEEIDEITGEPKKKEKKQEPKKQNNTPSIEERYRESTREAQLQTERNKQLTDVFTKVDEIKDPTINELIAYVKTEGFDWEQLSDFEKAQVKKSYVAEKKLEIINEAGKVIKDNDVWAKKVDTFLVDNETKQTDKTLIGREDEFRAFAMKASHRGLPLSVLVPAFLHQAPAPKKLKGSMFLTGGGGEKQQVKNEYSDADKIAYLRKNQPREYARLLKAGKIKIEV